MSVQLTNTPVVSFHWSERLIWSTYLKASRGRVEMAAGGPTHISHKWLGYRNSVCQLNVDESKDYKELQSSQPRLLPHHSFMKSQEKPLSSSTVPARLGYLYMNKKNPHLGIIIVLSLLFPARNFLPRSKQTSDASLCSPHTGRRLQKLSATATAV